MQDIQIRELSDQQLAAVSGGFGHYSFANSGVSAGASASGGHLGIDVAFADTKTFSATAQGESVSVSVGFAMGLAL